MISEPNKEPWRQVAKVLENIPTLEHAPLLAYLEQRARQAGDLAALRAVREYRQRRTLTTPPPND
jgi:hypothetical protein